MGEIIEFASNGHTDQGYLATPGDGGTGPGLIVIQEWWGLVDHIKGLCDRLAHEGFVTLAPDLYHGKTTSEPDEAGKLMMTMNMEQAATDMSGAVDEVLRRSSTPSVGVIGFCMGGGLALLLATQRPDVVKACVPFYGVIPPGGPEADWAAMTAAVQGHYAENDDFAGPKAVAELDSKLKALGKDVDFHLYPGTEHAFFNDDRPEVYNAEAAAAAWGRAVTFLNGKLGF
ncbi:MAG: dienelactone hydrolase family protein [Acidimicrobiales bacterium]